MSGVAKYDVRRNQLQKISAHKCKWDQGGTNVRGNFKFFRVKRNENRILAYYFHKRVNPMTMRESKVFEKLDVMMLQLGVSVMNRSRMDTNNQNCHSTRSLETEVLLRYFM